MCLPERFLTRVRLPSASQGEGVPLLSGEKRDIEALLPPGVSEEDKETMFSILGQAMCRPAGIQVGGPDPPQP